MSLELTNIKNMLLVAISINYYADDQFSRPLKHAQPKIQFH